MQGKDDCTTPKKEALAYLKCIQKGELVEMQGGHFAFMDDPITFNLIAEEFLYDGTCVKSSG